MNDLEPRPAAADLGALPVDDWSALLAVALPVVRELPERLRDATAKRVAALPPGRLASGRSRQDLAAVLVREEIWDLVVDALPDDADRPWEDTQQAAAAPGGESPGQPAADLARLEQQVEHLRGRERRLTDKVAELREEADRLRRERDGAVARAAAADAAEATARAELDAATSAAEEARRAADAADDRVARELARAQRREDAEATALRDDLRAARRARDELRQERDRLRHELHAAREQVREAAAVSPDRPAPVDDSGGRRGRPSRLPDGVAPGTRRAAEWLVGGGAVLLVDGYNVTRTHRPDLALGEQRRWLEEAVGALARRRQVDARVVWDSARGRPTTRRRRDGVTVHFTDEGMTADDELVLHVPLAVEPDRPVVAVTDDAELRTRLAEHGVDLLDSTSFTWLL